ncbi:MAG: hypothetical protein LBR89_03365, partial [Holosporales bacterium]|nr:hypothetical protein [Holosporales bacterium]
MNIVKKQHLFASICTALIAVMESCYSAQDGVPLDQFVGSALGQEAAERLLAGANQNDPEALHNVGMLLLGEGPGYAAEAIRFLRQAASQEHAESQYALGMFLLFGRGLDTNIIEAANLLSQAAAQGHTGGQYELGMLL